MLTQGCPSKSRQEQCRTRPHKKGSTGLKIPNAPRALGQGMVWVTGCQSYERGARQLYFLINATQALERAGGSLGSKHDANALFTNPPEPPRLRASPFTPFHLPIPSRGAPPNPPVQPGWQSQRDDRDVGRRAEDEESPKTRLNTKAGPEESSPERTRVPLLSVLICPV